MTGRVLTVVLSCAALTLLTAFRVGLSWPALLASLLTVLVLYRLMEQSAAGGLRLALGLAIVYAGVSFFNTLLEAVLFQVTAAPFAATALLGGATTAVLVAVLLIVLSKRWAQAPRLERPGSFSLKTGFWWRVPLVALCYCAFYLAAGIAIEPYIREFYAGRRLPSLAELLLIQFLRGAIYILVVLPWLRTAQAGRREIIFSLALIYSVLGGFAPLLLAADFMPVAIRWAHAAEVGVSNFLFGLMAGRLLVGDADGSVNH